MNIVPSFPQQLQGCGSSDQADQLQTDADNIVQLLLYIPRHFHAYGLAKNIFKSIKKKFILLLFNFDIYYIKDIRR